MTSNWHISSSSSSSSSLVSKCERLGVQLGRVRGWSPRRQPERKLSQQPAPRLELQTTSFFFRQIQILFVAGRQFGNKPEHQSSHSGDCNSSIVISDCVSTITTVPAFYFLHCTWLLAIKAPQLPTLVIQARMADNWVFDSLVNFLRGPIWNVPILTLIENKSLGRV